MLNLPEEQFLVAAIKHDDKAKLKDEFAGLISEHFDWSLFSHSILASIFYSKTRDFYRNINIPEDVFIAWEEKHQVMAAFNKVRMDALKELAEEFKKANTAFVVLKGAAELLTVYRDDYGARPMGDIDILIKHSDLSTAEEILARSGYLFKPHPELGRDRALKLGQEKNYIKRHAIAPIRIDLHWGLFSNATGAIRSISDDLSGAYFENANIVQNGNVDMLIPNPTDLILMTVLHGIKDFHYPTTSYLCWHINSIRDIRKVEFYCIGYYLVMAHKIKTLLEFNSGRVKWDEFFAKTKPLKQDPRYKQFLAACRLCAMESGLSNAYKESGIPSEISEKYWVTLMRKSETFFILDTIRNMRRDDVSMRVMAAYLFTYIFGARILGIVKELRRLIFGSVKKRG